jgi:hypothetical protein
MENPNYHPMIALPSAAEQDAMNRKLDEQSNFPHPLVYSSQLDIQASQQAQQFRADQYIDWDDEFNAENDYE